MATNLDMDALRSFIASVDDGGHGRAAGRVARSPSAVSLRMRKLETQCGTRLFAKQGRGVVLTQAGEVLLGYARTILDLNDRALGALSAEEAATTVTLGLAQDFAESALADILSVFACRYPEARVEARIDRSAVLFDALRSGEIDLLLAWRPTDAATACEIAELPVAWIGPRASPPPEAGRIVPLVTFPPPCLFRRAALSALEDAGHPWRIAFSSPALSGLWGAVAGGLGFAARPPVGLPPSLAVVDALGLPPLPRVALTLQRADGPRTRLLADLEEIVRMVVDREVAGAAA